MIPKQRIYYLLTMIVLVGAYAAAAADAWANTTP